MPKVPVAAGLMALALGPALAQAPVGEPRFLAEAPNSLSFSQLKGLDVIGLDHTKVGDIEEVVIERDGRVAAVVIGIGGVLGMGQKRVAVPFDQVLWNFGDVAPTEGPRGSTAANSARSGADTPPSRPERMPGAEVADSTLATTAENRSGAVTPETGPVATGSMSRESATVPVMAKGGAPQRAQVRMTRSDLERAPEFKAK
jgi:sporulation protein YlmC with PRC-barrel domain